MTRKIILLLIPFLLLSTPAWATNWCNDGDILGCWQLNIDENPVTDDSGRGNTGALESAGHPNFTASGKFDGAYDFDGGQDFIDPVDTDFAFDKEDAFSVTLWSSTIVNSAGRSIIGKMDHGGSYPGWDIHIETVSGKVIFYLINDFGGGDRIEVIGDTDITSSSAFRHIAVTYDGLEAASGALIYVNGVEETNTTTDNLNNTMANAGSFMMGSRNDEAHYYDGILDDIGVFGDVLSAVDVNDIMDNGLVQAAAEEERRIMTIFISKK